MKNILQLSTSSDIAAWGAYFLAVPSPYIAVDPSTNLNRVALVKSLEIYTEAKTVDINVVLYVLDANGNPINGYVNSNQKNIKPVEVKVPATNASYVNLQTMQVVANVDNLTEGVDYLLPEDCESISTMAGLPQTVTHLPEFEAYRIISKSSAIDLFALMGNAIVQSTKI